MATQVLQTLFPKNKGWSGSDLIDNAQILGYELKRIRGDHHILFHPVLRDTVTIPKKTDMRRLDMKIVKQLRLAERSLAAKSEPEIPTPIYTFSTKDLPPMAYTISKEPSVPTGKTTWFDTSEPQEQTMTPKPPIFKGSWFEWVRQVRINSGLSQKAVAELFIEPVLSEALMALVELGKRKFSAEEFAQWKKLFDITDHPEIPLASALELQRRETWHQQRMEKLAKTSPLPVAKKLSPVAPAVPTPTWFTWVRDMRVNNSMSLRTLVERMQDKCGEAGALKLTALHDVERGRRRFRTEEWVAWSIVFDKPTPPVSIPLADESSERAREKAIALRAKHSSFKNEATPVEVVPQVVEKPALAEPVTPLMAATMKPTPQAMEATKTLRDDLVAKVTKILYSTNLTDKQVEILAAQVRLAALDFLL